MPRPPLPPAEPMRLDSLAEVARGGMGSVELVRVLDGRLTGQILAVKRLHANIAEDQEFVSMFLDEAWITAALRHPNVAQVIAWGNDDKGPFLAIELVQGVSLSRLLKEAQTNQEPFAERTVAFICSQICAGLTAAHGLTAPDGSPLGIVHRDLTPANVLVSFDGQVKIIDFGIAKAEERITHTRTGQLKGKPSYMSPEQQRAGNVDHRADLFAFGVTMFELLAGRKPWTAKGAFDVMMEIANDPHPDLGELRPGLNPEFVTIAHKCLEKKPEARFNSAAEIKARLDAWLHAKGFAADDQHSLAQFVQRNSQPQVRWWQEALRGEHGKKKAPTFKELEERIDEEREKIARAAKKAEAARPVAGTPTSGTRPMMPQMMGAASDPASNRMPPVNRAPAHLSGTVPMHAFPGPPSSRQPASDPNGPASSGPRAPAQMTPVPMSPAPMSPAYPQQPQSMGGAALLGSLPAAQPVKMGGDPPYPPAQPAPHVSAPSPLRASYVGVPQPVQPQAAQPQPEPSGFHPVSQRWPSPQPVSSGPQSLPAGSARPSPTQPDAPPEASTIAISPGAAMPNTPYGAYQTGMNLPAPAMPAPVAPAPAPPTKSKGFSAGMVLLLVVIALVGGGAASAFLFRDQLLNLGVPGANDKPPAPKPAGKAR